jgi:transcriptional regulator of acetoin/glycerol metabolism
VAHAGRQRARARERDRVALALARGPPAARGPAARQRRGARRPAPRPGIPLSLDAYERCALERALAEADGDATRAARRLGIGRSTLYRKLARHGLRPGSGSTLPRAPAIR